MELTDALTRQEGTAEVFGIDEFVHRVAQYGGGITREQTADNVRAVIATLTEFITAGELDDVRGQLPPDYEELMH